MFITRFDDLSNAYQKNTTKELSKKSIISPV